MQESWMTAVTFLVAGFAIATTSGMYLAFKSALKKKLEENYTAGFEAGYQQSNTDRVLEDERNKQEYFANNKRNDFIEVNFAS